jgi:hypothetical protein
MNLPEQPSSTFRQPSPTERPWWWRLEDTSGAEVEVPAEYAGRRFATQADAESWVGETWPGLAEEGVDAVTLFEQERVVYGPMSLHA